MNLYQYSLSRGDVSGFQPDEPSEIDQAPINKLSGIVSEVARPDDDLPGWDVHQFSGFNKATAQQSQQIHHVTNMEFEVDVVVLL